uniref:Uncharacterized protein n=1 Tax=Canis lupus familiaris TaxID=9615 RepID=A0A8C0P1F8_CANLF
VTGRRAQWLWGLALLGSPGGPDHAALGPEPPSPCREVLGPSGLLAGVRRLLCRARGLPRGHFPRLGGAARAAEPAQEARADSAREGRFAHDPGNHYRRTGRESGEE